MDAGIIANFKHHYKKLATRAQLKLIMNDQKPCINQYQALCMCKKAWDSVTAQTIENCWYKTGLIPRPNDQPGNSDTSDEQTQLTECIQEMLDRMQAVLPDQQSLSAEQYTSVDNDGPTEAELSIEEAVQIVLSHDLEDMGGKEEPYTYSSFSAADCS